MTKLVAITLAILALAVAGPALAQDRKITDGPDLSDLPPINLPDTIPSLNKEEKNALAKLDKLDPKLRRKIEEKLERTPSTRDRYVYLVKRMVKLDERIDQAEKSYKEGLANKTKVTQAINIRNRVIELSSYSLNKYFIYKNPKSLEESRDITRGFLGKVEEFVKTYKAFRADRRKQFGLHEKEGKTEPDKKKAEDKPKKPEPEKRGKSEKSKKVSRCDETPGEENCVEGGDTTESLGHGESEAATGGGDVALADEWDEQGGANTEFADPADEWDELGWANTEFADPGTMPAPRATALECIARGASPTATGRHPEVVRNGDFRVTGNESYPAIGDAYNERTRWTCDFSRQLDISAVETLEVHTGALHLVLVTGEDGWFHTDTVSIVDLPGIQDPTIRSRTKNARTTVEIDLLDHYQSADIIARIKAGNGKIDLYYGDDSTVTFAELKIELRPAASETADLSGAWTSRYNWADTGWLGGMTVCLRQDGSEVSGTYTWDGGNKQGTLNGVIVDGNRLDYEYSGSDCTGRGFFAITPGDPSMSGTYFCGDGTGVWELTRTGQACGSELEDGRPELTRVEIVEADSRDPIDQIAIGQRFRVRLTYAQDPGEEITESVTVRTVGGNVQEIEVTGTGRVIVSGPILVAPADAAPGPVQP